MKKPTSLSQLAKHDSAIVTKINCALVSERIDLSHDELERRLLEIGVVENTPIQIMHFGLINKDPIAIRLENSGVIVAIRRNEADSILVSRL